MDVSKEINLEHAQASFDTMPLNDLKNHFKASPLRCVPQNQVEAMRRRGNWNPLWDMIEEAAARRLPALSAEASTPQSIAPMEKEAD